MEEYNLFNLYGKYLINKINKDYIDRYVEIASELISREWKGKYQENLNENTLSYNKKDINRLLELIPRNYNKSFRGKYKFNDFLVNLENLIKQYKMPLNQILYGPPGTGKTYATKKIAVEIIDGAYPEDRSELVKRYNELVASGQIHFTTFHQSMCYEDFIEGIKPKMNEEEGDEISYEIQDGIFKRICNNAKRHNPHIQQENSYNRLEYFDLAWSYLIEQVQDKIDNSEIFRLSTKSNKNIDIIGISNKGNLYLKPIGNNDKQYTVSYNRIKKLFKVFPDLQLVNNIDNEFREVIGGSNSTAYWSVLNFINNWIGEHQEEREGGDITSTEENQKYVLIIDEINRGNVSSILGELITLIEKDKRLGREESMEVILPYSKEKFSVPDNVYIIGTMNTADRSVEALDTALRRRFHFEEIKPLPSLLSELGDCGIDLVKLLDTINKRIELLIDKDHQIGHYYLLGVQNLEELKIAFKDKIIPLLEEYFYDDLGKIGLILGGSFIKPKERDNILAQNFDYDTEFIEEKRIYEFIDSEDWTEQSFKSIYSTTLTENEQ